MKKIVIVGIYFLVGLLLVVAIPVMLGIYKVEYLSYYSLCLFLAGGIAIIVWGIVGLKKNTPGYFQGTRKHEVDAGKYVRFMGILTIVFGLFTALIGILAYYFDAPVWIAWITIAIYLLIGEYGGKKYRM